jgi:SAM-dependent methyltransferase
MTDTWYSEWFNTPFYHILYDNRNEKEAELFLQHLLKKINLPDGAHILDLACGRGRHALFLNQAGFEVTGIDLSENNIIQAKEFENNRLHFVAGDMREAFGIEKYDAVLNLFTSFGYFEDESDNSKVLSNIQQALKKDGYLVIDYLNAEKIQKQVEQVITKGDIEFHITKIVSYSHVIKNIRFSHKGNNYHYFEKVQLLTLDYFEHNLKEAGFQIIHTFGNYQLGEFDIEHSERLILIAQKK